MRSATASVDCKAHDFDIYNITEEEASHWLYTPADTIMVTIVIPMIFCLGLVTNSTFFFVILRSTKLKTKTTTNMYVYLAHLAFGDSLYLILYAAFEIRKFAVSPVVSDLPIQNPVGLTWFWFVANTGYYTSIALVTMVSLERYLALCHPIKHLKIRSRQRTYRLVTISWMMGLMFSGVLAPRTTVVNVKCLHWPDSDAYQGFPSKIVQYNPYNDVSIHFVHFWNYYLKPIQNIPWFIAMVGNMYMYVQMIRVLNKRREIHGIDKHQKALHIRNQVAKMLIVNGIIFFMCHTPYNVITLSEWICLVADVPNPLPAMLGNAKKAIINIPILINNVINPLIYGAMSTQYREAFITAFKFKRHCRQ